jgi:hypothetical protein
MGKKIVLFVGPPMEESKSKNGKIDAAESSFSYSDDDWAVEKGFFLLLFLTCLGVFFLFTPAEESCWETSDGRTKRMLASFILGGFFFFLCFPFLFV